MDQAELKRFRDQLRDVTDRVQSDTLSTTDQVREPTGGQLAGELSNAPMHLGDQGTDEYLHDLNAALLENEQYLLDEAIAAMKRMNEGKFGICERCGTPIPFERLEAIPYARYCAPCASIANEGPSVNVNTGRPRSPADTLADAPEDQEATRRESVSFADAESEPVRAAEGGDSHAAGTPAGGSFVGGLAGTNVGSGEPDVAELQQAMGSGNFDATQDEQDDQSVPESGPTGGAVGGTPAGKRAGRAKKSKPQ